MNIWIMDASLLSLGLPALIVFLSAPSVGKREILLVTPSYQEGFDTWNLKNQQ
jgi:hypothetical protein